MWGTRSRRSRQSASGWTTWCALLCCAGGRRRQSDGRAQAKVDAAHGEDAESEVALFLNSQRSAVEMLLKRLKVVRDYTRAVSNAELPTNHAMLREIKALCRRVPSESTDESFSCDAADVLLVTYLTEITKGCSAVESMLEKHTIALRERSGRRSKIHFPTGD